MRMSDWSSDVCSSDLFLSSSTRHAICQRVFQIRSTTRSWITASVYQRVGISIGPMSVTPRLRRDAGTCLEYRSSKSSSEVGCAFSRLSWSVILPLVDRKTDVSGKSVSVRVYLGGRRDL